ncbi:MAG TPA: hypothetical protein VIG33_01445 [Pseudobdellovibrionaceae bacterium]|jgi:hypothetical protein
MKTIKIALGFGTFAILVGALIHRAPSSHLTTSRNMNESPRPLFSKSQRKEEVLPALPIANPNAPEQKVGTSMVLKSFEGKKDLEGYRLLSKKIFLTNQEKIQMQDLLKNDEFTRQLKKLFTVSSEYDNLENQQNIAVDFLLAAATGENGALASEILKSIIQDPATENESLSRTTRENLAGVKAEVLYRWSAQEPLKAAEMRQWLPGPVSEKIWKNVLAQQEMNRAESAMVK